jgi:hypothetical protein
MSLIKLSLTRKNLTIPSQRVFGKLQVTSRLGTRKSLTFSLEGIYVLNILKTPTPADTWCCRIMFDSPTVPLQSRPWYRRTRYKDQLRATPNLSKKKQIFSHFYYKYPILRYELKGTVQWELRWVKIGINRSIMMSSLAGKCPILCPKGYHHERSINVLSDCNTF